MVSAKLEQFSLRVDDVFKPEDPETFWACRPHFESLLRSGFLAEMLRSQLESCLSEQVELIQALNDAYARITLPCGIQVCILLLDENDRDDTLLSHSSHVMLGYAPTFEGSRLEIERYRHQDPYRNDVFDSSAALIQHPDQVLAGFEIAEVRAGREVFRVKGTNGPIPLIMLQSPMFLDFSWQYDPSTLRPTRVISPDVSAYRLFYATKLLGAVPRADSIEGLRRISHHKSHFVRWSAIQGLFKLDFASGYERLLAAVDDPHPRIRAAATQTIQHLARKAS